MTEKRKREEDGETESRAVRLKADENTLEWELWFEICLSLDIPSISSLARTSHHFYSFIFGFKPSIPVTKRCLLSHYIRPNSDYNTTELMTHSLWRKLYYRHRPWTAAIVKEEKHKGRQVNWNRAFCSRWMNERGRRIARKGVLQLQLPCDIPEIEKLVKTTSLIKDQMKFESRMASCKDIYTEYLAEAMKNLETEPIRQFEKWMEVLSEATTTITRGIREARGSNFSIVNYENCTWCLFLPSSLDKIEFKFWGDQMMSDDPYTDTRVELSLYGKEFCFPDKNAADGVLAILIEEGYIPDPKAPETEERWRIFPPPSKFIFLFAPWYHWNLGRGVVGGNEVFTTLLT